MPTAFLRVARTTRREFQPGAHRRGPALAFIRHIVGLLVAVGYDAFLGGQAGAGEEAFGADNVNTRLGINELRDVDITRSRDEGVGVITREVGKVRVLLGQKGNHVAHGHFGGGFKVFVEAHGDVRRRGFGAGPEKALLGGFALVDDELEGAGEEGFEGGDVDFTVALAGMTVSGFEEAAGGVDGVEDDGASG